jgi:2-polyprenyl-3-methyl-5-hydroxy-6-metoxy-1,4-benzoquinol methylase
MRSQGTLEDYMAFRDWCPKEIMTWDVLYLYEVLEHHPNPEAILLDCYELLNPGGIMVICVPGIQPSSISFSEISSSEKPKIIADSPIGT